jgi:uncharacterized protein (DUF1697 family)
MIYVALLRGINVGGNNKVDMKRLKLTFESAGMSKVVTYINTGNIIFEQQGLPQPELVDIIEQAITNDFQLNIKVVIRNIEQYETMMQAIPTHWTNDTSMKSDIMFLWEDVDHEAVLEQLKIKPDIDTVHYVPGAVLWSVARDNVTKSGMSGIIGTAIYKKITVRNVNTTRKIYELLQQARSEK